MKQDILSPRDLEQLYQAHKDEVLRYLTSLTHDLDDAHDLLQAVFMRLIQYVEQGKMRRETARAYIFRTAHNLFVDSYRRKQAETRAFEEHAKTRSAYKELGEPRLGIQDIFLELLASPELTQRQVQVVELRFMAMLEVEEIATKMQIGSHTVYREIRRILSVARTELEKLGLRIEDFEGRGDA